MWENLSKISESWKLLTDNICKNYFIKKLINLFIKFIKFIKWRKVFGR